MAKTKTATPAKSLIPDQIEAARLFGIAKADARRAREYKRTTRVNRALARTALEYALINLVKAQALNSGRFADMLPWIRSGHIAALQDEACRRAFNHPSHAAHTCKCCGPLKSKKFG